MWQPLSKNKFLLGRRLEINWAGILLIGLLLGGALAYVQHAFQYFIYDDEGCYAYAGWRISLGDLPYRDFLSSQMPAFLYWSGFLVRLCGRSYVALRLVTMSATLVAAALLYAANRQLLASPGERLLATAFFLVEANVFFCARFYQSEAYMLLWALVGVLLFFLSEKRGQRLLAALAGVAFALAILHKLFAALPLAGCFLYLLYAWRRERRPWRQVLRQGVALGLPALAIVGATVAFFSFLTPRFWPAIFEHHTMQGAGMALLARTRKALALYRDYFLAQPLMIVLAAVGACLALRQRRALSSFWVWQVPTVLAFCLFSRSLMPRHLTYLAPAIVTLAAWPLLRLIRKGWPLRLLAIVLALAAVYPAVRADLEVARWQESDSGKVAALVQALTSPNDVVLADYPGINFAAARRSPYWTADMSAVGAESGEITSAALIEEIERRQVALIIINTAGGAHHLVALPDYPEFRRYVQARFALVDKVQCSFQQLEVYARRDTMPIQPALRFHDEIMLTGVRPATLELRSGSVLAIDTRWQALQRMARDYTVSLRLVDARGYPRGQSDTRLVELSSRIDPASGAEVLEQLPTSAWAPGQTVLQHGQLSLGPATPPGDYYLVARLYEPASGSALPPGESAGARLPDGDPILATVRVLPPETPPPLDTLPIAVAFQAPVAQGLHLVGAGPLPTTAQAGQSLAFDLFWQAPVPPAEDYRLRFCLYRNGQKWQCWSTPVVAGYPTQAWRQNEVFLEHYVLPLSANLGGGNYTLRVKALDSQGEPLGRATVVARLQLKSPSSG